MELPWRSILDAAEAAPIRDSLLIRDPDDHLIEVGQTANPAGDWAPFSPVS
jgi:hypothetical protein